MRTFFIVHGSFGDSNEHFLPWLKEQLSKKGQVFALDFPIGKDCQTYSSWANVLDKYKDKINEQTTFIGRSIAPIFIIRYLTNNNLRIDKLIGISGFNGYINIPDYDYVNKTFLMDIIDNFKDNCKHTICFYSKNDPYVPFYLLDMFARCVAEKSVIIDEGGHFNVDSGYGEKFEELLKYI